MNASEVETAKNDSSLVRRRSAGNDQQIKRGETKIFEQVFELVDYQEAARTERTTEKSKKALRKRNFGSD
jgi:hypothetical protein